MKIPDFPEFIDISLDLKEELHPHLSLLPDGIAGYTFSSLYLWKQKYNYSVSKGRSKEFIISGRNNNKAFFLTPYKIPHNDILTELFKTHELWDCIPKSIIENQEKNLEKLGIEINEDRDNFDYIYLRTDLANLSGRKYHKKRNLVNDFLKLYKCEDYILKKELIPDAIEILDQWKENKGIEGDYEIALDSLKSFENLKLKGRIYYIDKKPAAWCLGESLAKGRMFSIHFEKALSSYKGIYQFINQSFASSLPGYCHYINREEDFGDIGLRQAKMSYYPYTFIKKYNGRIRKT